MTDVTPKRVEACLKQSGCLPDNVAVETIELEPFGLDEHGESKGLFSEIARVHCKYAPQVRGQDVMMKDECMLAACDVRG